MTSEFAIAIHALVYLNHKQKNISSEELAENICTNPARIRKVMAKLKKKNLIGTKEGLNGGYQMIQKPEQITLRHICDILEIDIVKAAWRSGKMDVPCMISSGMAGVMDGIYKDLNHLCKEYLENLTVEDIENKIFHGAH